MATVERKFTELIICWHCQNKAPMEIMSSYAEDGSPDGGPPEYYWHTTYQLCQCPACHGMTVRSLFYGGWMEHDDEITVKYLYPLPLTVPNGLPIVIRIAYEEAQKVRKVSVNAYAVMLGRILELVCSEREAEGDDLSEKLHDLAAKGEIPNKLADVAHKLRQLRNYGAHASLGDLTAAEVPILDNLIEALLEYVYSAPSLVSEAEERLNTLKKAKKR